MESGYFRSKKGYTVVQNDIVRDLDVSMKAKGLYLVIQSYITMPDKRWKREDFEKLVKEGNKAFTNAWNELKEKGYLKIHMYSFGYRWKVEYDLLYEKEEGPHTFYYDAKGKLSSTNIERKMKRDQKKKEMEEEAVAQKAVVQEVAAQKAEAAEPEHEKAVPEKMATEESKTQHVESEKSEPEKKEEAVHKDPSEQILGEEDICTIQKGRYISENAICTPPFAIHPKEGYGERCNNNNTYIINPYTNTYNPSIYQGDIVDNSLQRMDGLMEVPLAVVIDPNEYLSDEIIEDVNNTLARNQGIPYDCILSPGRMKTMLQVLSEWNFYCHIKEIDKVEKNVYLLFIEALTEMTLDRQSRIYNGSYVNYHHVIDQVNKIYTNDISFINFVDEVIRRFMSCLEERQIRNVKQYMKSVIWSMFSSYQVDFQNYFYNSYYNNQNL